MRHCGFGYQKVLERHHLTQSHFDICSDQSTFLDMMERYFQQPTEVKLRDARPHLHYQVCLSHPLLLTLTAHLPARPGPQDWPSGEQF